MAQEHSDVFIDVRVAQARRRPPAEDDAIARHVVVLDELEGNRSLLIWMGPAEASQIAALMEQVEFPRPTSASLLLNVIHSMGGKVREVRINQLAETTFYAQVVIAGRGADKIIDARPSDAIPLAMMETVPIRAHQSVLDTAGTLRSSDVFEKLATSEDAHTWLKSARRTRSGEVGDSHFSNVA